MRPRSRWSRPRRQGGASSRVPAGRPGHGRAPLRDPPMAVGSHLIHPQRGGSAGHPRSRTGGGQAAASTSRFTPLRTRRRWLPGGAVVLRRHREGSRSRGGAHAGLGPGGEGAARWSRRSRCSCSSEGPPSARPSASLPRRRPRPRFSPRKSLSAEAEPRRPRQQRGGQRAPLKAPLAMPGLDLGAAVADHDLIQLQ